jgi:hypothetical protein
MVIGFYFILFYQRVIEEKIFNEIRDLNQLFINLIIKGLILSPKFTLNET